MFRSALRQNLLTSICSLYLWTWAAASSTTSTFANDVCAIPDQWRVPVTNQTTVDEVYFPPNYPIIHTAEGEIKKLKYKHDFASADAGTRVLASAPGIKGVKAIQRSSHETYMMSECNEPVWVVLALPERVSIELVAFETSESFSSYFRKIAILGAARYPTKQWRLLAVVELDPARIQNVFSLKHVCKEFIGGSCWVSYIKFQVLSYMPNDSSDVCTLSRFSVYGSTVMQGLETKMKKPDQTSLPDLRSNTSFGLPAYISKNKPSDVMSIPFKRTFTDMFARKLYEESMCMLPEEHSYEESTVTSVPLSSIKRLFEDIHESHQSLENLRNGSYQPADKDLVIVNRSSKPSNGSQKIQTVSTLISNYQKPNMNETPLSALLEKIISDSLLLEEKTRLSSSMQSVGEMPPIITLVDRLNDIQKVLSVHMNKTTATTLIVKNLVGWLSMMNADLDLMRDSFRSQLDQLVRASSSLQIPEFMKHLTRRICADSFSNYSLIEASEMRSHRRSICVVSAIYSLDMVTKPSPPIVNARPQSPPPYTQTETMQTPYSSLEATEDEIPDENLQRLERIHFLLAFTDSGRVIREWRFSYVLNLYLEKLRHRFGPANDYESVYETNPVYKSAQLYLDSLAALYWPPTFLHIFPLPPWSSTQIFFKHPIIIYWSVVTCEALQVFGRMFYTICSALIYAFVVGSAYIYVQSRHAQENPLNIPDDEYGFEQSPTSPCRRFFAADYNRTGEPSIQSGDQSTPNSSSLRQHYDHLLHTLGRVRQGDKKMGYRRLKSK